MFAATRSLAIVILLIGLVALGLAGYTYFIVLPPAINGIDQTAGYLINFRIPSVSSDIASSASEIRKAADSMPDCAGVNLFGCNGFDMRETRKSTYELAKRVDNMNGEVSSTAGSIESQVHSTGWQLYTFKGVFQFGLLSILMVAVLGVLSGVALLLFVREVEAKRSILSVPSVQPVTESVTESASNELVDTETGDQGLIQKYTDYQNQKSERRRLSTLRKVGIFIGIPISAYITFVFILALMAFFHLR